MKLYKNILNLKIEDFILEVCEKKVRSKNSNFENRKGKYRKYFPYVFTEQGVAMLSGIIKIKLLSYI